MQDQQVLTIEKIPVRLTLSPMNAEECLAQSGRSYFSVLGKHPMHNPLMHQIGRNADCQAVAICVEQVPLAHLFFHYRHNDERKTSIVLHNVMVAPFIRGRGLGGFLLLVWLRSLVSPDSRDLTVEIDFPAPFRMGPDVPSLVAELMSGQPLARREKELAQLSETLEREIAAQARRVLRRMITAPEFRSRVGRSGCSLGVVSDNNAFFETIGGANWPDYVAVQAIHTDFHPDVAKKVEAHDLVLLDGKLLAKHPSLITEISRENPHLPLVLAGAAGDGSYPAVVTTTEPEGAPEHLSSLLINYLPETQMVKGAPVKENLFGLPERGSLVYYKNRHRSQRLFIVASGPSLAPVDPERFRREITMTINDALVKFPFTRYAAIMDSRKLHELHLELMETDGLFTLKGNSFGTEMDLLGTDGFSTDLEKGIYSGYTTAYFALQVAIYMGFKEIFYLGLDMGNTGEQSHFFGNRHLQDRDRPEVYQKMRQSFERVAPRLKDMGIAVYNCSPTSELKCFAFRSVEEVLRDKSA